MTNSKSTLALCVLFGALFGTLLGTSSCSKDPGGVAENRRVRPLVYTTTWPLHCFVSRIAKDLVDVECVAPEDADLRHWRPDRTTVALLQGADLIVVNGAGLEAWSQRVSLKRSRVVDAAGDLLAEDFIVIKGVVHTHGGNTHSHDGKDPFVWLNPRLAKKQAQAVAKALQRLLPDHKKKLAENLATLEQKLTELSRQLTKHTVALSAIVTTESYYGYLGRGYVGKVLSLDLHGENAITREQIAKVEQGLGDRKPNIVLCPRQPDPALAKQLADAFSTEIAVFDPCLSIDFSRQEKGEDFLSVMTANIQQLTQ